MPDVAPDIRAWLASQLTRRPAVMMAALMMLGIGVHESLPHRPGFWLIALLFCLAASLWWAIAPSVKSLWIGTAIFCAGVALAQCATFRFPANHVGHFAKDSPRLAQIELLIEREPRVLGDPFSVGRALPPKQVFVGRATKVKTWNGWVDSAGGILVQIDEPHPRLQIGQTIRALGMLQRPSPAMNPGQFNWADYYREQRVLCSIGIDHAENIQIVDHGSRSLLSTLRAQTRELLAGGFADSSSLDHALMRALLLGDHDPELRDVQEQFRRTGTSHHLAISGMHVAILGIVVHFLCRIFLLPPRVAGAVAIVFVVLYGVVALPSPPVVRSVLLCVAFGTGILFRRSVDPLQLLAVSVIAMLVYHPLDLFNAGFQLSFGTVLGLILFTKPLADFLSPRDADIEVLRSFHKLNARQEFISLVKHRAADIFAASLVAWVVSTPLIAYHFEQLNPWAIPGSILLAPFVFVALVGGFAKILLTALFPFAAPLWAMLAVLPMEAMRDVVDLLAALPGAEVPLPQPPVWLIVLFYVLLLLPRVPIWKPLLRRGVAYACTAGGVIVFVAPFAFGFRALDVTQPKQDEVSVTLLAVGAGQCAVVAPPRGPLVLIDCGSASLRDPLRRCIAPFIRHLGRSSINRVILSHGDYDHISAAAEIVTAYGVNEVMTGPHFSRHAAGNAPAEGLLRFLEQTDRTVLELVPGNKINLGGGAVIEVLWPPRQSELNSNDSGLVLRLTYAGRSVLFPADIQVDAQSLLLDSPNQLRSDVVVAPHHGSREETTSAFISAVNPSIILSSNDRTLTMKQTDFEDTFAGRKLYRTHRDGSVTVRITKDGKLIVGTFAEMR